jgi:four helix bundle protein
MKDVGFKTFEEMEVWRAAQELAVSVYRDLLAVSVYRDFSKVKDYSFCDQVKRAAVSISNNIAEGSERTTSTEFSRFLDIAKGSAGEVRSMYRLAVQLGFLDKATADQRCLQCASISKQLGGFAKFLRRK